MDVANIALTTNANPMLAQKMEDVAEMIMADKDIEESVLAKYSLGEIDGATVAKILNPIKIRQKALMSPTGKTRRDIFFELQATIPALREAKTEIENSIFLLADFIAAKGIYEIIHRPMPEAIRNDHNYIRKLSGMPPIKSRKQKP